VGSSSSCASLSATPLWWVLGLTLGTWPLNGGPADSALQSCPCGSSCHRTGSVRSKLYKNKNDKGCLTMELEMMIFKNIKFFMQVWSSKTNNNKIYLQVIITFEKKCKTLIQIRTRIIVLTPLGYSYRAGRLCTCPAS
jgi:hypothetical protein